MTSDGERREALRREMEGEENKDALKSISSSMEQLVEQGERQVAFLETIAWQNRVQAATRQVQLVSMVLLTVHGGLVAVIGILMAAVLWGIAQLSSGWYRSLLVAFAIALGMLLYRATGHYRSVLVDTYNMIVDLSSEELTEEGLREILERYKLPKESWQHRLLRLLRS